MLIREILSLAAGARDGDDLAAVNEQIRAATGIEAFFGSARDVASLEAWLVATDPGAGAPRDAGDFQTPPDLARRACARLAGEGISPVAIIEPSCGSGTLVAAAIETFPDVASITCVEIQERHEWAFKARMLDMLHRRGRLPRIRFHRADAFRFDFASVIPDDGELLILGNPPWVTNAALGTNVPVKRNIKRLGGIASITGKSNFDVSECLLINLIQQCAPAKPTVAMLCKEIVVRNLVRDARVLGLELSRVRAFTFDARREFGVHAGASLLVATAGVAGDGTCAVAPLDDPSGPVTRFGWHGDRFVANHDLYGESRNIDGACPFEWRQGVKHDLSRVMVLQPAGTSLATLAGDPVDIERELVYPLVKSSDLAKAAVITSCRHHVIIPQRTPGQDTRWIHDHLPRSWAYLASNSDAFASRRSRVYLGKPPFSVFGVGDYAFKPFKVAISGFYKTPNASLIVPVGGKPVMLDDTCYFLSFDELLPAVKAWIAVNSVPAREFLASVAFLDAKRPYTKDVLMRLDLDAISNEIDINEHLVAFNAGIGKVLRVQ